LETIFDFSISNLFRIFLMTIPQTFDTVIIGAGPAGSAAAALLAEQGLRVLAIEREKFPRYHIGESLLPFTCYPLKRLGLFDRMRQSEFVKKYSAQFISASGKASQPFYFSSRYEPDVAQTWQVLRSEFDLMLMENARSKGAEVLEETTVRELIQEEGRTLGVRAQTKTGDTMEFRAPMTLDCSGRDAIAPTRLNWRVREPKLNKVAVWTYYRGALRDPGIDAGATTVAYIPEKGWFWYIPQHRDMVSVGVVAEGKYLTRDDVREPKDIFNRELEQNAWIKQHLACGTQVGSYFITSEFSWRSRYCAAHGLLLAGDAFGFLDPVFSSGVMLALKSGMLAADAIKAAFDAQDFSADRFTDYGRQMREGLENMRKLVYAFYDPNFSFRKLTDKYPEMAGEITDCLSGDINKDFSRLFKAIADTAEVPEPLPYGAPRLESAADPSRP
jgi:flavin-dependent dehydrogenase